MPQLSPSFQKSEVSPLASLANASLIAGSASALAHDARNLLSAINLYCDLLREPGVLSPAYSHYAQDLLMIAQAGSRLVCGLTADHGQPSKRGAQRTRSSKPSMTGPVTIEQKLSRSRHGRFVQNLAAEVLGHRTLLAAVAGNRAHLDIACLPCPGHLRLASEDLLRILTNLVRNAAEAANADRPQDLAIRITAQRGGGNSFLDRRSQLSGAPQTVVLSVHDNGPGIAATDLPHIFGSDFTTKAGSTPGHKRHGAGTNGAGTNGAGTRGLGLAIVRSLVESAGGCIRVISPPGKGARFEIELPVVSLRARATPRGKSAADGAMLEVLRDKTI